MSQVHVKLIKSDSKYIYNVKNTIQINAVLFNVSMYMSP